MARQTQIYIKYLTVSAMLCALGVILLSLGALVEVLDISVAVIASFLVVYAVIEMGGAYPWMIWLVTSIVGYLLMPKTPVLFFALFFGFYPILKEKAEKLPRVISWVIKFVIFHISLVLMGLGIWFLFPDMLSGMGQLLLLALTYLVSLVAFFVYDVALTRIITFYFIRLRHRFHLK
ncbi:MAG: hypothetical protein IJX80_09320 [Clostridia bacterium]|nr:hypothetical protein [Clostridia bacterium]